MKNLTVFLLVFTLLSALACPALAGGCTDCPLAQYPDLAVGDWYHDGVHYCLERGILTGEGGIFLPDGIVDRTGLIQAMYCYAQQAGLDVSVGQDTNVLSYEDAFDIPEGAFEAFQWACGAGILGSVTSLQPAKIVTREDMVCILYRFAQWAGLDNGVGADTNILSYEDAFDITEGAFEAFQWACGAGIIRGTAAAALSPKAPVTRTQLATVLQRMSTL